ncbi:hypothetical protein [Aliifodinibius sp. S!AR15-10]|uniref:hypothetical protein n=1 Tax=Aliifodinibius sp. S!AR15-10 TaxID=2950437 RepID=UPI00286FD776|nr:hypothetical protein [Aliifodinibius sp. S!AR15-10]
MKKLISKSITLAKKFFGIAIGRMVDHLKSSVFNAAGNLMEQFFGEANLKTLLEDKVE